MTFPTIPTGARVLSVLSTTGGATRTSPSLSSLTKNAGDLLIAICIIYDGNSTNAEFSSWGGGFTEFADFAGTATMGIGCAYKWSTGSETGTFTVTTADASTNDHAFFLLSIPGAHATTPPEAGGFATGTGAANPASFDPAGWDVEDTLWIAVGGSGETATTGSYTGLASAPSTFSGYIESGISADAVGGVEGAVAFLQSAAASLDVGAFTGDTSNARDSALVIAVRPVEAAPQLITPDVGTMTLVGFAPTWTATTNALMTPGVGALVLTGFAPTVLTPRLVTPGVGTLTLTGFAPTVAIDTRIVPGVGTLTLAGFAPTVLTPRLITPGVGALTLTGFVPTVLTPILVTPGTGTLALTGFAPTVSGGEGLMIVPDTGSLVLTGFAPTWTASDNKLITPGLAMLTLAGFAPTVTISVPDPDNATATITTDQPVTGAILVGDGVSSSMTIEEA